VAESDGVEVSSSESRGYEVQSNDLKNSKSPLISSGDRCSGALVKRLLL
jgi:hypothetical protein